MKTSLEHLPPSARHEVRAIAKLIREAAPVDMVILYGSFAENYDIAVIVKNGRLANQLRLWSTVEQSARGLCGRASVRLIVHGIRDINHHLRGGHFFFTDLVKGGIMLYDSGRRKLSPAKEPTPAERLSYAQACFREYIDRANRLYEVFEFCVQNEWYSEAAIDLHQATECYYKAMLQVFTAYRPKEHDLAALGKRCAALHPDLHDVFPAGPTATSKAVRRVKLLEQAYMDAPHDPSYRITREELEWLAAHVGDLRVRVERVCQEHLAIMAEAAG